NVCRPKLVRCAGSYIIPSQLVFLFNAPPPPDPSTLPLHDALPISIRWIARDGQIFASVASCASAPAAQTSTRATGAEAQLATERSEEHTSELQSLRQLVCRLPLEKKNEGSVSPSARRGGTPRPQSR